MLEGNRVLESSIRRESRSSVVADCTTRSAPALPETVEESRQALLWVLNALGRQTVAARRRQTLGLPFPVARDAAAALEDGWPRRERRRR